MVAGPTGPTGAAGTNGTNGATGATGATGSFTGTASRAVVTDGAGALSSATTTSAEIGYVNGVTSAIQTQINAKAPTASPTFTGAATFPLNGTSGLSGLVIGTKQVFVSSTTPTGMAAGDIWIQV
jgi:hypothetical protein